MPNRYATRKYTCSIDGCERVGYAKGLCAGHYDRNRRYGDPSHGRLVPGMDLRAQVRRYSEPDPNGCWLWTGGVGSGGYGQMTHAGKNCRAHRVSYEAFIGPIPDGLQIDHLCRVRSCVNPDHLEPVTAAENKRRSVKALGLPKVCGNGHDYAEWGRVSPSTGKRYCQACNSERARRRRNKSRVVRDTPAD